MTEQGIDKPRTQEEIDCIMDGSGPLDWPAAKRIIDSLRDRIAKLERERDSALALLSPNDPRETLDGAIRNLQQAHVSERDNAEKAERRLSVLEEVLRCAETFLRRIDELGERLVGAARIAEIHGMPQFGPDDNWCAQREALERAINSAKEKVDV